MFRRAARRRRSASRTSSCGAGARRRPLYAPALPHWPPEAIRALRGLAYADVAIRVMTPFIGGEFDEADVAAITSDAYSCFRHAATAPIVQIELTSLLSSLFHGPTLAFKDFAMQWLGRAMNHILRQRGARATILGATSGDTGAAAIEAFGGRSQTDVYHPLSARAGLGRAAPADDDGRQAQCPCHSRRRDVRRLPADRQRRCSAILPFRDEMALSGVNSINWARILAQIVYYFVSAVALGAPDRPRHLCRPDRKFWRHSCRLLRQAHGPANRAAHHRDQ